MHIQGVYQVEHSNRARLLNPDKLLTVIKTLRKIFIFLYINECIMNKKFIAVFLIEIIFLVSGCINKENITELTRKNCWGFRSFFVL